MKKNFILYLKLLVCWCINKLFELFKNEWVSTILIGYSCYQVELQIPRTIRMVRSEKTVGIDFNYPECLSDANM